MPEEKDEGKEGEGEDEDDDDDDDDEEEDDNVVRVPIDDDDDLDSGAGVAPDGDAGADAEGAADKVEKKKTGKPPELMALADVLRKTVDNKRELGLLLFHGLEKINKLAPTQTFAGLQAG